MLVVKGFEREALRRGAKLSLAGEVNVNGYL
jgi:hypothetical protein